MAFYTVIVNKTVTQVSSLRKAKALSKTGENGIVFFQNGAIVTPWTDATKTTWPTEYAKFKKCGTRPLVRKLKSKQANQYLLVARERLQKLLNGETRFGDCGMCAYLTRFNDHKHSRNNDSNGSQNYYPFVSDMIYVLKQTGWNFYELKSSTQECYGVFGPIRREFAEKVIKLIDEDRLVYSNDEWVLK